MRHHGMSATKISNCDAGRNADGEKTSVPTVAKVLLMPVLVPSPPATAADRNGGDDA